MRLFILVLFLSGMACCFSSTYIADCARLIKYLYRIWRCFLPKKIKVRRKTIANNYFSGCRARALTAIFAGWYKGRQLRAVVGKMFSTFFQGRSSPGKIK
jgi:hypothetical protein